MRWTVSLHRIGDGFQRNSKDHLDWFFEQHSDQDEAELSGKVITFASDLSPTTWRSESGVMVVRADRLPDHRHCYLDYKGDISDNRGQVTPILTGQFQCCSSGTYRESSVDIELLSVEICDRQLPAMVQLAESWRTVLRSDLSVRIRIGS